MNQEDDRKILKDLHNISVNCEWISGGVWLLAVMFFFDSCILR